jgi:hypothetical protein
MRDVGNAHKILVGKPEGRKMTQKTRHRWEACFKMRNRVAGCGTDSSCPGQGKVAGSCKHSGELVSNKAGNFLTT